MEDSIPDVIVQFSWKNKMGFEEQALDDIMTKEGGSLSMTRPRVGYLIKVKFSKKRTLAGDKKTQDMEGLDIYRLSHGTTVADARDPTNSSVELMHYTPGGPEIFIVIKAKDLGITGLFALLCGDYVIKASKIYSEMDAYHKNRQARGLT
jgi:hypothetical protein